MKKEIIRINNLSYKVKDGDEEKMLLNNISISFEIPEIITISGPSGSGKTTFLNALSQFIPREERIITIEDSAELQLIDKPNLVRLETRNANTEGVLPITIRDLIKTALRMRPNRVIVGECRGAEALDVLQAIICTI